MISVCIASYNGRRFIKEQLESILPQLSFEDEVIISDDGSRDDTLEIVQSFKDNRIVIIKNVGQHGFVGNFENALKNVHGDYVFFSDQDDIWESNKVRKSLNYLQSFDLIVHDALLVDEKGASLGKNRFLGCCMAMKRNVIDYSLPFPKNTQGHDYWIGMLALTKFKVGFVNDVLIHYRRHGENLSSCSEKSGNSLFYKILKKRLPLLTNIILKNLLK